MAINSELAFLKRIKSLPEKDKSILGSYMLDKKYKGSMSKLGDEGRKLLEELGDMDVEYSKSRFSAHDWALDPRFNEKESVRIIPTRYTNPSKHGPPGEFRLVPRRYMIKEGQRVQEIFNQAAKNREKKLGKEPGSIRPKSVEMMPIEWRWKLWNQPGLSSRHESIEDYPFGQSQYFDNFAHNYLDEKLPRLFESITKYIDKFPAEVDEDADEVIFYNPRVQRKFKDIENKMSDRVSTMKKVIGKYI